MSARGKTRTNFGRLTGKFNAMVKAIEKGENSKKLITFEEAVNLGEK